MVKYLNKSNIEWTDYTWNPVVGCRNGCSYCYAKALCKRFAKPWGLNPEDPFAPRFYRERISAPLRENKNSKIFMMSMGELWGDWVPHWWQTEVLRTVRFASWHTFLNLTKNPQGLLDWQAMPYGLPPNLWLGVSVTGDDDESRLHDLAKVDHPNKFVSFEPLLADVTSNGWFTLEGIKWVIIGAQTGPGSQQPEGGWLADLLYQTTCRQIPTFVKDNLTWRPAWKKPQEYPEGFP